MVQAIAGLERPLSRDFHKGRFRRCSIIDFRPVKAFARLLLMTIEIKEICRYPVKGLAADTLDTVDLEMGECLPYDRKWGIIHAASKIDPAAPRWVGKANFLMLARDEKLGQLGASFDAETKVLTITRKGRPVSKGNLSDPMGRSILQTFLAGFMPTGPRGNPRIVEAPGKIRKRDWPSPHGGWCVGNTTGFRNFDSLAVDGAGNICVATLMDGGETLAFGGNQVDLSGHTATTWSGATEELSNTEVRLLQLLAGQPGVVLPREEIVAHLFGPHTPAKVRTLDNLVARLRKLFERDSRSPQHLHTVRGVGLRFTPEAP